MPNYTKNYNLIKPNKTENYDIEDVTNKNMDILDEELFGKEDKVPGKGLSTNDFTNEYKNKLDGLENYDDTELINKLNEQVQKNNLQEQKIEELQSQITNLQEENTQLKDQIPNGQSTGNPIYIKDSSNLEASIRLNGGDKQVVTELGENILDSTEYNGIEITEDTNTGFGLSFLPLKLGEPLVPGNYSFAMFFTDGTVSGSNVSLNLYDSNNSLVTTSSSLFNFTEEQIAEIANYRIFTNTTGLELYMGKTIQGAMLVKGSTKPSVYKEFIHASPTPNNPSKVETVGSNINIFDKSLSPAHIAVATATELENGIRIACTSSGQGTACVYKVKDITNLKGKTFTVKANWIASADNKGRMILGLCDTNGQNRIMGPINNTPNTAISYTIPDTLSTSTYLALWLYANSSGTAQAGDYVDYTDIKIEPGNQATAYSPYGMGSVEIDVSNKQLFNIRDLVKGMGALNLDEEDFVTVTVDNSGGTSTKYYNVYTNPSKLIKPNTKYYLIMEIKKVSGTGNIFNHSTNETDHKPQFSGSKGYNFTNLIVGDIKIDEITSLEDLTNSNSMLRTFLSFNTGQSGSITFRISVLEEEPTAEIFEYTKYEQQTKIMPIQQEMLEGDYIEDVEHHGWNKLILDGTENIQTNPFGTNSFIITLPTSAPAKISETEIIVLSTHFKGIALEDRGNSGDNVCYIESTGLTFTIRNTEFTTLEAFKSYLAEQYSAGTPVIVYYKLATPIDLELTEEQKEAKKINTYKNVTNIVADNELATLDVTYKKDQNTVNKNYEDRIAALEAAILS